MSQRPDWFESPEVTALWEGVRELIRQSGEDPDEVIAKAAANLEYWVKNPYQGPWDAAFDEDIEYPRECVIESPSIVGVGCDVTPDLPQDNSPVTSCTTSSPEPSKRS